MRLDGGMAVSVHSNAYINRHNLADRIDRTLNKIK